MGDGWNTFARALFRKRELTELRTKHGEFCEKLGLQIIGSKEVTEFLLRTRRGEETHRARCLKPYSPKPYDSEQRQNTAI